MERLRNFTESDYCTYADATPENDGTEPQILEYGNTSLILANGCLYIPIYMEDTGNEKAYMIESHDREYLFDILEEYMKNMKGKTQIQQIRYIEQEMGLKNLL